MVLTWRVTSMLPLLGDKVERLFARQLRTALAINHAFTLRFLQQMTSD